MEQKIFVTKPALPPLEELLVYMREIWESKIITNNGPFHQQFENNLAEYLGVKYISLFSNGTLALITAIQAMKISGEVITTPYSFVATTHALWWNNIKPVFADINPVSFALDPDKVEAAITPKTTAILPVHVYGIPCDVIKLQEIADRYGLKLLYDAAHAFGVRLNGTSLATFGDLSVLSFHATKVFNTFEGGAIICHDKTTKQHIDQLKNFGIINETTVLSPGINAKMNEFQSALGILQLRYLDEAIGKRKILTDIYRGFLDNKPGITIMQDVPGIEYNFAYFPILIDSSKFGRTRDEIYCELKKHNIFSRRYFYPLISQFPTYKGLVSSDPANLPNAEKITQQVLCLPIYPDLEINNVERICNLILG
jgi:dTDP-4-amino-4,6-dideoxygalactose transaminase